MKRCSSCHVNPPSWVEKKPGEKAHPFLQSEKRMERALFGSDSLRGGVKGGFGKADQVCPPSCVMRNTLTNRPYVVWHPRQMEASNQSVFASTKLKSSIPRVVSVRT